MPFIRITLSAPTTEANAQALATGATRLIGDVLGKKIPLTAVLVEVAQGVWTVGAKAAPMSAQLEANITAGTNTTAQKSQFIAEAMSLLRTTLGTLPEATYVIVREIPADDWGYNGITQATRAHHGLSVTSAGDAAK